MVHGYEMTVVGLCECTPHPVRLRRAHSTDIHQKLYNLLLPHDYPVAAFEGSLFQGMFVLPLGTVPVSLNELAHRALGGAHSRPYQRYLVGEIEKVAGKKTDGTA